MKRLLLAALALLCLSASPATASTSGDDLTGLSSAEVAFTGSGGLALHGTVLLPEGATAPLPGMVLVHGSGTGVSRKKLMTEATAFAHQGLAVLIYDKRSQGYSLTQRSYTALADDAIGAVGALRAAKGVDPGKIGVWGLSEGGWVAPLAATRSRDISFVVTVGGNAMEPLRQQTWAVAAGLRKAGVSGALPDRSVSALYRLLAGTGQFPEPYYDAQATLGRVTQPVLGIWGADDLLTPPQETPGLLVKGLSHDRYTLRFFPGADHAAHLTPDGGVTRSPELAPGYAEAVGSWVREVTSGSPPKAETVGTLPRQASFTAAVPPLAWWESGGVQLAALLLFLVAFVGYPLWLPARALLRRTGSRHAAAERGVVRGRAVRVLAICAPVAVTGALAFLMYSVITGGKLAHPGPVLAGRPLIWLALQALAVAAVVATAFTFPAWRRAKGSERVRLGLLLAGGVAFVPWAFYWGLLLP
ncbi:hypothetical protein OIE66_12655 [Nonomuraea sp. NBC_01738]|uniref:alpha/beta hydrolase n=1 Tax=Nonomuraea sp. NBC_01738 TaxID=2976003 RepID=UPI002E11FE24|nr:hypothetical protein OIE66_12655 [Nonomuraea sp. NBC_01738]